MHILHIALGGCLRAPPVTYGLTPDTGGHIAYVLEAAKAQARCPEVDHVTIVTRRFRDECLGLIHDTEIERVAENVSILRIGPANAPYLEKDGLLSELPVLTQALLDHATRADRRIDIVHAHFADAAVPGLALARAQSIPLLYTPHALGMDKLLSGAAECPALKARIVREEEAMRRADGIIVSTRDEANRQIPRYGVAASRAKLRVIAPGVPRQSSGTADHGMKFIEGHLQAPERPLILAIARPVEKKNLAFLARTYAQDRELQRKANLVILAGQQCGLIAGSEEARVIDTLREIRSEYGLADRFALPRRHEADDVAGLYRLAARSHGVFVNPARHEPFGLTLLEAACVGLPVIATNQGGPVDIIGSLGHGILISPESEAALAGALHRIIDGPAIWSSLAQNARQAETRLGWEGFARGSIDFYRDLMSRTEGAYPSRNAALPSGRVDLLPDIAPLPFALADIAGTPGGRP